MNYQLFTSEDFFPKTWSGGETTQLFIFPNTSDYAKLDFDFRLSTATVDIETSVFTALPNVSRQLMVLDGQMRLEHEHKHSVTLNPGDIDCFEGDWTTTSKGTCIDFNLMTIGGTKGKLKAVQLKANTDLNLKLEGTSTYNFIYIYKGEITIAVNNESIPLGNGTLIKFEKLETENLNIKATEHTMAVIIEII